MFKNGDVLLAWYGGLTGVQARSKVKGANAIAQGDADPKYYSYVVAHKDTGLKKSDKFPAEIANLKFTFGPEQSTSGRLMPEFFFRKETKKAPADFFKNPVNFSKSHDQTAELVASGQFQAGVLNYKVYDRRVKEKKTDPETVVVIWQTPYYADYNWTAHPDLEKVWLHEEAAGRARRDRRPEDPRCPSARQADPREERGLRRHPPGRRAARHAPLIRDGRERALPPRRRLGPL
jgi:phosphonate transport system substrate-binding protein